MKILFIVQGEGRGHLTQAISMERLLRSNGHEVVEVLVGKSESRRLPGFFIRNIQAPVKQFISPNFLPTFYPEHSGTCQTVYQPEFPAYPCQQTGKPDTKHLI